MVLYTLKELTFCYFDVAIILLLCFLLPGLLVVFDVFARTVPK